MKTGQMVGLGLASWLGLAVTVGATGLLAKLRPPLPQIILFGLTAITLLLCRQWPALRAWTKSVPVRVLVAYHLVRFVGFYLLWLHTRGELPYAFAVPGGIGDIIVATLALLLLRLNPEPASHRKFYLIWNVLGLVDISFVVATAARLALILPGSMDALLRMPLSLLPTFVVPLIFATHVLIFFRLGFLIPGIRQKETDQRRR